MLESKFSRPIFLLEDSEEDIFLFQYALKKLDLEIPLAVKMNTEEALEYLNDKTNQIPKIIIFDINLPGASGEDFLAEIKNHSDLRTIPAIAFSSSLNHKNIHNCYQNGASSYIVKPVDFDHYLDIIQTVTKYWYQIASTL